MADQIDEIKQKVDIVSVIGERIELKKAGRNFKALCPFHGEKTPSFMVSPEMQIYKCFGCGETGDIFSFLEKYEGMEFYEALKYLAEKAGVKLKPTSFVKSDSEKLYEINNNAVRFYNYILLNHAVGKPALDYLLRVRGLTLDTVKAFNLGFSPDVAFALKRFLIEKKKFTIDDLTRAGIVYKSKDYWVDRFRGRVVFPLHDHRGNTTGFAGRILPGGKNKDLAKYINTPETAIYHKSKILFGLNFTKTEIKKKNEAIIVEGELDAISCWQAGFKNVVAIKGSSLTEDQVRLLKRYSERVIFALDSDMAGDAASRRGIAVAQNQGLEMKVAILGEYKDPDDIVRKDPKLFAKILEDSVPVWDFIINSIFSKNNYKDPAGVTRISKEVIPVLASIEDDILQAHYIKKIAQKLDVPFDVVKDKLAKVEKEGGVAEGFSDSQKQPDRRDMLEERLLSMSFQFDPEYLLTKEVVAKIKTPLCKKLVDNYILFTKHNKKFEAAEFLLFLPAELKSGFSDLNLKEIELNKDASLSSLKKEATLIIKELDILDTKERLKKLESKIKLFEEKGEKNGLHEAEMEFSKVTNTLSELEAG